jgi:hypothetical protein
MAGALILSAGSASGPCNRVRSDTRRWPGCTRRSAGASERGLRKIPSPVHGAPIAPRAGHLGDSPRRPGQCWVAGRLASRAPPSQRRSDCIRSAAWPTLHTGFGQRSPARDSAPSGDRRTASVPKGVVAAHRRSVAARSRQEAGMRSVVGSPAEEHRLRTVGSRPEADNRPEVGSRFEVRNRPEAGSRSEVDSRPEADSL